MTIIKNLIPQTVKNWFHFLLATVAVVLHGYPAKKLQVIGVTGTDGKTTTSTYCYTILKQAKCNVALISTVAAYIGNQEIDTGFHVTSPDPWQLQKLLKEIVKQGCTHVVLEATSHGLHQHRLLGTNITYAVFTNITREHLDYHQTYDHYLKAKAKLMDRAKVIVLNGDDSSYKSLRKLAPQGAKIVTYSHQQDQVLISQLKKEIKEPYNQSNALAAIKVAESLDIPTQTSLHALTPPPTIKGRMEQIPNNRGLRIIVDFAHTPNALERALKSLKPTNKGKLIAVYGKAGLRDPFNRPLMGNLGAMLADVVIFTAEDPRTESLCSIIYQMKQGVKPPHHHKIISVADREKAINLAINHIAKKGDTVVCFGKGHEQSMNLDGRHEIPWSDQEVVGKALSKN